MPESEEKEKNVEEKGDHDRLVRLDAKVDFLCEQFRNHLKHHWMVTIPLIGITGTAIISLLVVLLSN